MAETADPRLWDVPREWNLGSAPVPMRNRCLGMGRPGRVNREAILRGAYGERLLAQMADYIRYPDEMDPEMLARLAEMGLEKKLMRGGDPLEKWSLYIPTGLAPDARRPLILLFHGAGMPIHFEEHTGYLPICARDKVFMACPQNHDPDNALMILREIMDAYPIDPARVYCAGFSQGAIQLNALTIRHPELFAAAAPCGMHLFASPSTVEETDEKRARAYRLPCVAICGQEDALEEFPVCLDSALKPSALPPFALMAEGDPTLRVMADMRWLPREADGKLNMLNKRLMTVGRRPLTLAQCRACMDSPEAALRALGAPADRTREFDMLGVRHFAGDFLDEDGRPMLRIISLEGINHWPPATMAELAWDFMRRFSRDPATGRARWEG